MNKMQPERPKVFVLDDEAGFREQICDFIARLKYAVADCANPVEGLEMIRREHPDIVLLDIKMPEMNGIDLLRIVRNEIPDVVVVMISGHGTMELAIDALRLGATDFLKKPVDFRQLEAVLERCRRIKSGTVESTKGKNAKTEVPGGAGMIGESAGTREVQRLISMVAASPCQSLLITGETGAGKEVAAKLFHRLRHGGNAPFVAENCPALPENLVESELFGHEKGAFTGATKARQGSFERADGGTLFLDEVGDLTPLTQAKLLRVLETRKVRRVGSTKDIGVNVAVVAATNRSLLGDVAAGRFRRDLFFRLNAFSLHIPPLRERREDIIPLAFYFLQQFVVQMGMTAPALSPDACSALEAYHYPGNARELSNMIERACIMSGGRRIERQHISFACQQEVVGSKPACTAEAVPPEIAGAENTEVALTRQALEKSGWNRRKAAALLGISYDAIRWRIRKYDLKESASF